MYHFDVTDIAEQVARNRTLAGIQRAALMILRHAATQLGTDAVGLVRHDRKAGRYLAMEAAPLLSLDRLSPHDVAQALGLGGGRAASDRADQALYKYPRGSLKFRYHKARLDWEAARGNDRYFLRRGLTRADWQRWRHEGPDAAVTAPDTRPFEARAGDVVCVLGSGWDTPRTQESLESLSAQGLRIAVLIHDVIPLKLPGLVHGNPAHFRDWLFRAAGYADLFLANSRATAADLAELSKARGWQVPISVTPLAQAPLSDAPAAEAPETHRFERADLRDAVKLPYALCVGTMAAHKNNWRLAQAWVQVARRGRIDLPRLVFAGKRGWANDDFFAAYEATAGWGGWVRIVESPSDEDLIELYRGAVFTALPSLYEGWGLPAGESLAYGKTALVSRCTSLPEVGGDMVAYCDPASIPSIAEAVAQLCDPANRQAFEQRIAQSTLRGWPEVGQDVADALAGLKDE